MTRSAAFYYASLAMWEAYHEVIRRYRPVSLEEERALIALAQRGSRKSRDELMLRHVGFVISRLHKKVFPRHLRRHGQDLMSAAIPVLMGKIKTYDLHYRDESGRPKPVRFSSYIWKRVDGFLIDSLKEIQRIEAFEIGAYETNAQ